MAKKNKNNKNNKPDTKKANDKIEEIVEEVKEQATEAKEAATDAVSDAKEKAEKLASDVKEKASDAKENAKEKADKAKKNAKKSGEPVSIAERKVRYGIMASTSVVIVILLVIALNVILSSKEWSVDLTKDKLYSLSDETEKILDGLDKDHEVTIYFMNSTSAVNSVYKNILTQYDKHANVTVVYKDLEKYPQFPSAYLDEGAEASEDDMIVVCGTRYRYLKSADYLKYGYDQSGNYATTINIEPKVTSSINYCVSGITPIIYTMTGQGEQELGENFKSALDMDNYDVQNLDIVSDGGIPTDCDLLVINAPSSDLPESVITTIKEYMDHGGRMFVAIDPNDMYTNLNKLLESYGVKVNEGIMVETGSGYYMGNYPTYLLPTIAQHEVTEPLSTAGLKVLAPVSKGLTAVKVDGYEASDLLMSSDQSFSKVNLQSESIEKEDEDIAGPLAIAEIVDNASGDGVLFVSGCSSMGVDDIDNYTANGNTNLYANAVNYLIGQDEQISIKPTNVSTDRAMFSAFAAKMVIAVGIVGLPVLLILVGVIVVLIRKKK
ncbi:MAG: Gldg family protein [Lachnospiraceae bacterium]|nr:Gldg family protein [Lachnospiraceae bacterium]